MTISTLSIPYSTRTQKGSLRIRIMSSEEFMALSERVSVAASEVMRRVPKCSERDLFNRNKRSSLLLLSKGTVLDTSSGKLVNGELIIVMKDHHVYVGFISLLEGEIKKFVSSKLLFHHHRLDSFSSLPEKLGITSFEKTVFAASSLTSLESTDGSFSLSNLYLMLLSDYKNNRCALLCCKDPFPPAMPVPILCSKEEGTLVEASVSEIEIPFLMGTKQGKICFPVWSLDKFKEYQESMILTEEPSNRGPRNMSFIHNSLIMCTKDVSFHPDIGFSGGKFVITKHQHSLGLGFIPEKNISKKDSNFCKDFYNSLLEVHQECNKNYLYPDRCSSFFFDLSTKICSRQDSDAGFLSQMSIFLLVSERTGLVGLLCKKGSFEIKHIDPTNPEAGFLSIEESVETASSSEEPPKKRPRQEEEKGESSQAAREALVAFNRQRDKEAAAAEALLLLSGQEKK